MKSWILAPRFDLIFFSSFWKLIPSAFIISQLGSVIGDLSFLAFVYGPLVRLPHFLATFVLIKDHSDQIRLAIKNHAFRLILPIVLFLVFTIPIFFLEGRHSWQWASLFKVSLIVANIHLSMQNYMILQIYRKQSETIPLDLERYLEKSIFLLLIAARVAVDAWGGSPFAQSISSVLSLIITISSTIYITYLVRKGVCSLPFILFFATALMVTIPWPFAADLPKYSQFYVFNAHHSIAYLGLVFLMKMNKIGCPFDFGKWAIKFGGLLLPLICLSGLATYACLLLMKNRRFHPIDVMVGFMMVHYYIDFVIWTFKSKVNREHIFPKWQSAS